MIPNLPTTSLQKLVDIMALLRSQNGCQWDREQTPETLKKHILEEAYELLEAIDKGSPDEICDELGDLLLQVVFQAQIFSEENHFTIEEVAEGICNKLIRRHPHIFADAKHEGHEDRWEQIKQQERSARGQSNCLAQRIPKTLPALKRATKTLKKTSTTNTEQVLTQLLRQTQSLHDQFPAIEFSQQDMENQLGELFFSACRLAICNNIDPEDLLREKTTQLISEIDAGKEI